MGPLTWFDPQPDAAELPARLPDPFAAGAPHPLARRAAEALQARLPPRGPAGRGKMFGVLVVREAGGRVGALAGFSGMLDGAWEVDGFVGPVFDAGARAAIFPADLMSLAELERGERTVRSHALWDALLAGYRIPDGRGAEVPMRALFAPETPPGGAGDCAAPKLFAHAIRAGLQPLASAEFWWGPPNHERRRSGQFYPACRGKCGPVLAHMLGGLLPEEPRILFDDEALLIADKPPGLRAMPGRSGRGDALATRLRRRHADLRFVHQLEDAASGLMLAAKDAGTQRALVRLLSRGELERRHVAWLDGELQGVEGRIDAEVDGRAAITEWRVRARAGGRTQVVLWPRTDRPRQLRAHARALGAPIVGDGAEAEELRLRCEAITFVHPRTGARMVVESA